MFIECEVMHGQSRYVRTIRMSICPRIGEMVDAGDGNFRQVKMVYHKDDTISLWLEGDGESEKKMKQLNWLKVS